MAQFPFQKAHDFFLNSLHQLCQVRLDSLFQILHEGTIDLPDIPWSSFKNVAAM